MLAPPSPATAFPCLLEKLEYSELVFRKMGVKSKMLEDIRLSKIIAINQLYFNFKRLGSGY